MFLISFTMDDPKSDVILLLLILMFCIILLYVAGNHLIDDQEFEAFLTWLRAERKHESE